MSFQKLSDVFSCAKRGEEKDTKEMLISDEISMNMKSLCDYNKFKANYIYDRILGKGGFGIVYEGFRWSDGLPVAVKCIEKSSVNSWGFVDGVRVPLELCLMCQVSCIAGVIQVLDASETKSQFFIVMERPTSCRDLFDFISERVVLSEAMAKSFFRQALQTIYECYQAGVLHRDIKDENILIDLQTYKLKLIDFGAGAYVKETPFDDFSGTLMYAPPEWLKYKTYNGMELTVWTLGIFLYIMVFGQIPFKDKQQVLRGSVVFKETQNISADCQNLILSMLEVYPENRPTLDQVLSHPWLRSEATNKDSTRSQSKLSKRLQFWRSFGHLWDNNLQLYH